MSSSVSQPSDFPSEASSASFRPTKAVISFKALRHNLKELDALLIRAEAEALEESSPEKPREEKPTEDLLPRQSAPSRRTRRKTKICFSVKADAYGHGLLPVALAADKWGVDCFGVALAEEGALLRKGGIRKPLLVFSPGAPEEIPLYFEHKLSPLIASRFFLNKLIRRARREQQKQPLSVHLKVDTGMGRFGCTPEEALSLAEKIHRTPELRLDGVCTHLAAADALDQIPFTLKQISRFKQVLETLKARNIPVPCAHAAGSAGILNYRDEALFDMVRPGILLYGYPPRRHRPFLSGDTLFSEHPLRPWKPLLRLESKITFLKTVPAGQRISYGCTWAAPRSTRIATLPLGYGDGYNRLLSSRGQVLIKDRLYPVVGRVCMDQILVNLGPGSAPAVRLYDKALLWGDHPRLNAQTLADLCHTIPYEILCNLGRRLPRLYR